MSKPYFHFSHSDDLGIGYQTLVYNTVTRRFKHLVNFDFADAEQVRKNPLTLQHLMSTVDLCQRIGRVDQLVDQLEVSFDLVNASMKINPKETCVAFEQVGNRLARYEEEVHYRREDYYKAMRDKESRPIRKFKAMFAYYDELYKDYYSIVSAFPAFCHGVMSKDTKSISNYLNLESKQKIEILSSPLILKKHPISLLTKGCERHIRNAISHENRHIFLDNNTKARLVDVNAKGIVTYDKTFTIEEFEEVLRDLSITIESFRMVLVIFNTNYIKEINAHLPKKVFSPDDVEKLAFSCAKDSFLDYQSMILNSPDNISFVVKVQARKRVKSLTIELGPFSQTTEVKEIPEAVRQIARFLQMTYHYTGSTFKKMNVSLIDLDDKLVGEFQIDTDNFSIKDADEFIKKAVKNTIPENYKLES